MIRAGSDASSTSCCTVSPTAARTRSSRSRRASASGQRHREPQGPLQPRVRLLHRDHQDAPREGAGATTSASRRSRPASATSTPELARARGEGADRRGDARVARGRAVPRRGRARSPPVARAVSAAGARRSRCSTRCASLAERRGDAAATAGPVVDDDRSSSSTRRAPPGDRGDAARRHASSRTTAASTPDAEQLVLITGPEHGRQVDVHAPGRADRAARADRHASCRRSRATIGVVRSRVHARRRGATTCRAATRRSWSRCARPRRSSRNATRATRSSILDEIGRGTSHVRRRLDRVGGRRAPARRDRRADAVRDALPRARRSRRPSSRRRTSTSRCGSGTTRSSSCGRSSTARPPAATASRSRGSPACRSGDRPGEGSPHRDDEHEPAPRAPREAAAGSAGQMSLLATRRPTPCSPSSRALDVDGITPLEALQLLAKLKAKA